MYYDIFYEIKKYVSLYPDSLEKLTWDDLKKTNEGGNENGSVDDSRIICSNYRSLLL